MRIATTLGASATAVTVLISAAFAQQSTAGTIVTIDRVRSTIGIQQTQSGTVGASAGGATEEYKVQDRALLDSFHAGDKVTYSAADNSGTKTITKIQQQ